jgi:hypothetical protein
MDSLAGSTNRLGVQDLSRKKWPAFFLRFFPDVHVGRKERVVKSSIELRLEGSVDGFLFQLYDLGRYI